ncbi:MAG TPA: hypothetical protein VI389_08130 [Geobacteraceae bacterium]
MSDCEFLKGCIFFNDKMANMPSTAEIFKIRYCRGDNAECARYVVCKVKGRDRVPQDLFPNQIDVARQILTAD